MGQAPINWLIKRHVDFHRTGQPDRNGLRRLVIGVSDFEKFALALWPRAPVGTSAVTGDVEVAAWRNGHVRGEHVQARNQRLLAHVADRRLHKPNPPDFTPGLARDKRIAFPPRWAE